MVKGKRGCPTPAEPAPEIPGHAGSSLRLTKINPLGREAFAEYLAAQI